MQGQGFRCEGASEHLTLGGYVGAFRACLAPLGGVMRQASARRRGREAAPIRAQGKLVTLIAAVLQSAGVKPMADFAALLGTFAIAVGETNPCEGEILAYWAAMVREGDLAGAVAPDPPDPAL